ncbi:Cytochrome b561 domain-containing protein 1 [Myotis davidii]|uniref:ascorbate ferrireductase (transmembrane) n=1 Tax=Myotis davidii TaxID=225400 RepID=L5M6X8_MYODS|nr:Cytochrome b561 domain-containing protein 1 [Myotis davidii]
MPLGTSLLKLICCGGLFSKTLKTMASAVPKWVVQRGKAIEVRIRLHWVGQTLALLCAALGLGFIIVGRTHRELPHLASWHGWVEALMLLATGGQPLCGLCLLFSRVARVSRVAGLKLYHLMCGLVVYLIATVTVFLGMYLVWFQAQIKGAVWYLCLVLPLYPALVIMHQISSSYLLRKKMEM